jgi:O-antigen/teichoic acid export membrane protein
MENSNDQTLKLTFLFYGSLIVTIFLGWVVAKLNTSYLSVSDYGKYSFFIILIFFSRVFFTFGISESSSRLIAIHKVDDIRRKLTGIGLSWVLLFVIPYSLVLYSMPPLFDSLFQVKIGEISQRFSYLAGLILIHAFFNLSLRGYGKIKLLAFNTIAPRAVYIILLILLINYNSFTLINTLSMLFYGFAFSLILVLLTLKPKFQDFRKKSKQLWAEVKSYGIHIYISNIWHEILFHGDKFVISYYLDDNAMAYYALGYMITFPLSHFSTSLSTTLFNKFISQNKIRGRDLKVNILFVAVSVSIIIFFRRFIIVYLFSEKYLQTIDVILPLALAFGLAGLSKPLTMFLMVHGHGKIVRNISVTVPLIQLALNIAIVPVFGIIGAAWIATFIYGLDLFLVYFFYNKIIRSI